MAYDSTLVAAYILRQSPRALTPIEILKLVYIAHGWSLGFFGKPLITEPIEAWRHGPVARELYDKVKQFGTDPITPIPDVNASDFDDESAVKVMDWVVNKYSGLTWWQLVDLTHEEDTPWHKVYVEEGLNHGSAVIGNSLIKEYYQSMKQKMIGN